jgi:uncharacterized protein YbjQ (UPF0145 family)
MIVTTTPTIEGHTIKEYNLAALLYPDVVRRQIHRVSFLVVSAVDAHPLLALLPQA